MSGAWSHPDWLPGLLAVVAITGLGVVGGLDLSLVPEYSSAAGA